MFDTQLDARAEWEKYKITGNVEHGEKALGIAENSGYDGQEKSALLRGVPELSKAYEQGVSDNATDWAIAQKLSVDRSNYLEKYGPMIPPTTGQTYEGPIVHGTDQHLYQATKIHHNEVLVRHERACLSSIDASTLATGGKSVNIKYVGDGVGIAKPVKELEGPRSPEYQHKGSSGIGR
ncbi:KfrB domain-containing protein [Pseudomonas gingeri]